IDGKPTKGMTLNEAIKLMRGEPNTSIVLTIARPGRDKPLEVNIVRDIIKVRSVRSKMLDNDIAYVRIAQFQERTAPDLVRHRRVVGLPAAECAGGVHQGSHPFGQPRIFRQAVRLSA